MKTKIFTILFISSIVLFNTSCKKKPTEINNVEIPAEVGSNQIVEHFAYTISYNEMHEQSDWVVYLLTREEATSDLFDRTDNFRPDPDVMSTSAELNDYYLSGYDRGHLAPAADMAWSETAMSESFFMSNMSPQVHSFNAGKWFSLEKQTRIWADIYNGVYVVVGPILEPDLPTIGDNEVSVPKFYYKIIVSNDLTKGIAFVMPNESLDSSLVYYAVSISEVEDMTGIDFFPKLRKVDENKLENSFNLNDWEFSY